MQIIGWDYEMQPAAPEISTCPTCGGLLEKTPDGGLGCMVCLLRAGIGSEAEVSQDSTGSRRANTSALLTRTAMMGRVSLCDRRKS
jgi:hypothetical protein